MKQAKKQKKAMEYLKLESIDDLFDEIYTKINKKQQKTTKKREVLEISKIRTKYNVINKKKKCIQKLKIIKKKHF